MPTPACTLNVIRRFIRLQLGNCPDPRDIPELAADWSVLFAAFDDDAFVAMGTAYLTDKTRGRFFPTPADLFSAADRIEAAKYPSGSAAFSEVFWVRGSFGSGRKEEAMAFLREKGYPIGKITAGIDAIGGWHAIGNLPDPKYGGNGYATEQARAAFSAAYTAAPADSTALAVA